MFLLGVRTSTWAAAAMFVLLGVVRRDRKPLLAGWAWFWGFEAVYQLTGLVFGGSSLGFSRSSHGSRFGDLAEADLLIILGAVTVPFFYRQGIRPSWRLMAVVALIWIAWMATGFHHTGYPATGLEALTEGLNETAKTAWAAAYLWPLRSRRLARLPAGST